MVKKIITQNLPGPNMNGQYSYDDTLQGISIDGQQQLYSIVVPYSTNINYINDYRFLDSATFKITKAEIVRVNSWSSYEHDFRVYFVDDGYNENLVQLIQLNDDKTITYNEGALEEIEDAVKGQLGRFYDPFPKSEFFYCGKYWEPGDLVTWDGTGPSHQDDWECQLWDDILEGWHHWDDWEVVPDWNADPDDGIDWWHNILNGFPYDDMDNPGIILQEFIHPVFPYYNISENAYYIILYANAHENEWLDEEAKHSYTVYRIDKNDLVRLWKHEEQNTLTIKFEGSTYEDSFDVDGTITYPMPTYIEGGYGESAKYRGNEVTIEITLNGTKDFYTRDNWAIPDIKDFHRLNPDNPIDYQFVWDYNETRITNAELWDFRPISYVAPRVQWEFDLQRFYEYGDGYIATTAPNQIDLTFRLAENNANWFPTYFDGFDDDIGNMEDVDIVLGEEDALDLGINCMMYVYDWDGQDMDIDWNYIVSDFPSSYDNLIFKQRRELYNFEKLFETENGIDWTLNSIPHQYSTAGSKIIKAVIFSYVPLNYEFPGTDEDGGIFITPLRWKAVNIKINLGYDMSFIEDFSDVGGFDYTFLPWPETAAVISGISNDSAYVKAVREIVQENRFAEDEYRDYNFSHIAFENLPGRKIDEVGNYLGKVDLGQIRFFNKPYDMNDLLMLDDEAGPIYHDNFINYDNFSYWYSYDEDTDTDNGMPQYPRNEKDTPPNSCIGLLFIKNDTNISRMESCIMELNFKEVNGITIRDTSGNDNRGLLIGDYIVDKPDFSIPLNREEAPEMSEIDSEKLAF